MILRDGDEDGALKAAMVLLSGQSEVDDAGNRSRRR